MLTVRNGAQFDTREKNRDPIKPLIKQHTVLQGNFRSVTIVETSSSDFTVACCCCCCDCDLLAGHFSVCGDIRAYLYHLEVQHPQQQHQPGMPTELALPPLCGYKGPG